MSETFDKGIKYSGNRCRTAVIYPSKIKMLKEELYNIGLKSNIVNVDEEVVDCLLCSLFLKSLNKLQWGGKRDRVTLYRLLTLEHSKIYSRLCENISDIKIYNDVFKTDLGALTVMVTSIKRSHNITKIINYYMELLKDEKVVIQETDGEVVEIEHRLTKGNEELDDFLYESAPNYKRVIMFTDNINQYIAQVG